MSSISQKILHQFVAQGMSLKTSDLYMIFPEIRRETICTAVSRLTIAGHLRRTSTRGMHEITATGRVQEAYVAPPPTTPAHKLEKQRARYARYNSKRATQGLTQSSSDDGDCAITGGMRVVGSIEATGRWWKEARPENPMRWAFPARAASPAGGGV